MKVKRVRNRFIKRLETEFEADGKYYRGISSDLSESGLFIRTQHPFVPDTLITIVIYLPDSTSVKLRGRVRRSVKSPVAGVKNGMGVELIESDARYLSFVRSAFAGTLNDQSPVEPQPSESFLHQADISPPHQPPEFKIITCPRCGVKNRVNAAKLSLGPKCGKCGSLLKSQD